MRSFCAIFVPRTAHFWKRSASFPLVSSTSLNFVSVLPDSASAFCRLDHLPVVGLGYCHRAPLRLICGCSPLGGSRAQYRSFLPRCFSDGWHVEPACFCRERKAARDGYSGGRSPTRKRQSNRGCHSLPRRLHRYWDRRHHEAESRLWPAISAICQRGHARGEHGRFSCGGESRNGGLFFSGGRAI